MCLNMELKGNVLPLKLFFLFGGGVKVNCTSRLCFSTQNYFCMFFHISKEYIKVTALFCYI